MAEQPSYFSILTASVRYDPRLKKFADEKVLFSEITALSNKYGYCTASNKYFSKLYDRPIPTISKWINHLKELGYLKVEMVREGKEIKQRKLFPNANPIHADVNTYSRRTEGGIHADVKGGINVDVKENNTSINNTSINKEVEEESNAFTAYQLTGATLTGLTQPIFADYVSSLGDELVKHAIEVMSMQAQRPNFNYLRTILENYINGQIKTVEQAKKFEKKFKNRGNPKESKKKHGYFKGSDDPNAYDEGLW